MNDEITFTNTDGTYLVFYSDHVGCWQIGGPKGLSVHLTQRPRWLTRLLCRWLLQWVWVDTGRDTP